MKLLNINNMVQGLLSISFEDYFMKDVFLKENELSFLAFNLEEYRQHLN